MLDKAILQIYPDADFSPVTGNVELQDDGGGAYIARWDYPAPQPTEQELQNAYNEWLAGDLDRAKILAITIINDQADAAETKLDSLITGKPARAMLLNTEIVEYYKAGRPADPAANVYVIANALALRREITLRAMLENLFLRWRNIQAKIALIVTEFDRLTEAINAAGSRAEIEAILAGAEWP